MALACCVRVVDVGTLVHQITAVRTCSRQVVLVWEKCPDSTDGYTKPQLIYKSYDLSFSALSPLRLDIERWLGEELTPDRVPRFDLKALLGRYCHIQVDVGKATDAEDHSIHLLPIEGEVKDFPKPITTLGVFVAAMPDLELLQSMPEDLQARIKASSEFVASHRATNL